MTDLSIGIPMRTATVTAVDVEIRRAMQYLPSQIVVSINDAEASHVAHEARERWCEHPNTEVLVVAQGHNLGLYGNFRWLAERSTGTYFLWMCQDDEPTPDQQLLLHVLRATPNLSLAVPSQEVWTWSASSGFRERVAGVRPPSSLASGPDSDLVAISPDPSWIFGTWRRSHLVKIFPSRNFDWLDYLLLESLLTKDRIASVDTIPARVGWNPRRPAHSVGKWHNPIPFSIEVFKLLPTKGNHRRRTQIEAAGWFWRSAVEMNMRKLRPHGPR